MRVCVLARRWSPVPGDPGVHVHELARELVRRGHDVTLVAQHPGEAARTPADGGGGSTGAFRLIRVEPLGERDGGDFERDIAALRDTVLAEHARRPFAVLHALEVYPAGAAVLEAARACGAPAVVSVRPGGVGSCCGTHAAAVRAVLQHAGGIVAASASAAQDTVDRLHGPAPERFTIVPDAIDPQRFGPSPPDPGPPNVLHHGRVDRRGGVLDFLQACARLHAARVRFRATVSGGGPDQQAAKNLRRRLGLHRVVGFAGPADADAVPARYSGAAIVVAPVLADGPPTEVLEAMASGLPVVAPRAIGVADVVRHEDTGLLVPPEDPDALAAAILRLLEDGPLRHRLAATALARVREVHSWGTAGDRLVALYETLQGSTPDSSWSLPGTVEPCRFRVAPHLL